MIKFGVPQRSTLGPLIFLFYINDLPKVIINLSWPILFAGNVSLIITNHSLTDFKLDTTKLNEWFNVNLLTLNYKKKCIQLKIKNIFVNNVTIGFNNKCISNTTNTKFHGIIIENSLPWKAHIDLLLPKMCAACYAITAITPFMLEDKLRLIYYSYIHSLITYAIIFWGNSSHSIHVYWLQKRI